MKSKSKKSDLYGVQISTKLKKKNELISYLKELLDDLKGLEQDIQLAPRGINDTALELISPKNLENPDKEIRVLTACCIVEILRIYVPDAPYDDRDMLRVFEVFISQIRGLQTNELKSEIGKRMFYILTSLATVKSCVIPVIMALSGDKNAEETVRSLFESITESIQPDHGEDVLLRSSEILVACISEYEDLPSDLLELLLIPLLPISKAENPLAYRMAASVLSSTGAIIEKPFTRMVQSILIGTNKSFHERQSELSEEIYSIIFELHKISPEMLLGVIPFLTMQLTVEEEEIRSKAVKLLGKLYSSEYHDYTKEFPKDFKDYLGRLNDLSSNIRNELIDTTIYLLKTKPEVKSLIEENVIKRLRDPEEDVRLKSLNCLLKFAQEDLNSLSVNTFIEISERAKDKKFEVRKTALLGLAKLYYKNISMKLSPINSVKFDDLSAVASNLSSDIISRLQHVPGIILKSFGYPEFSSKHLIIQLVQEYLLPKTIQLENENGREISNEALNEIRTSALVYLFHLIDESDKNCFAAILTMKSKINDELSNFVHLKSKTGEVRLSGVSMNASTLNEAKRATLYKQIFFNLVQIIPSIDKKNNNIFEKLIQSKDKFIIRLLRNCIGASDSISDGIKHKTDLQERLDSKSLLGEYMGLVFDFASHHICNSAMINCLLSKLTSSTQNIAYQLSQIITYFSKFTPKVFIDSSEHYVRWLDSILSSLVQDKSKTIRSNSTKELLTKELFASLLNISYIFIENNKKKELTDLIISYLNNIHQPMLAMSLGEILTHLAFCSTGEDENMITVSLNSVQQYLRKIFSKKELNFKNDHLSINLNALVYLVKIPYSVYVKSTTLSFTANNQFSTFEPYYSSLVTFLKSDILQNKECDLSLKITAVNLMTNFISLIHEGKSLGNMSISNTELSDLSDLSSLLFECIENEGKMFCGLKITDIKSQIEVYECCSTSLIFLMKIKAFSSQISVEQWQELAWTFVHEDANIRQKLLTTLVSILQIAPVHPRFLTFPCLFANDSNLADRATKALVFAIKRMRVTHDDIGVRLMNEENSDERAKLQRLATMNMPEVILPYLLHLLSYHPDFPSSVATETEDDVRKVKTVVRCVQMLLLAIQSTLRNETSDLPYFFKQLNLINSQYVDRLDENNIGLHFVTRLASRLLSEQVKTAENVQVYPGDVYLPPELYQSSSNGVSGNDKLNRNIAVTDKAGLEGAEYAIDKALQITGKVRKPAMPTSPLGVDKSKYKKASPSVIKKRSRDEDEIEEIQRAVSKKASKATKKEKILPPKVEPSRVLPSRHAKAQVQSYIEVEENEREVQHWEEAAEEKRKSLSSSDDSKFFSNSKPNKISLPMEKDDEDFDIFVSQSAKANSSRQSKSKVNKAEESENESIENHPNRTSSSKKRKSDKITNIFTSSEDKSDSDVDEDIFFDKKKPKKSNSKTSNKTKVNALKSVKSSNTRSSRL